MLRQVMAVFVGFLLGIFFVFVGHMTSSRFHPPPVGINAQDTEAVLDYIRDMPLISLFIVIVSHALGAFVGAYVSSRMADRYKFYTGIFVGTLFLIATVVNAFSMPHSFAVAAIDIFSVFFAVYLGAMLGFRQSGSGR